jgi:hypothetical protein
MSERKTAAELEQIILKEVSNLPACQGLTSVNIDAVQTTWRVNMYGGDPARPAECLDAINTVVYRLRGLYDLMPEDAAAKRSEMTARAEKMAGEKIDRMLEKSDQPERSRRSEKDDSRSPQLSLSEGQTRPTRFKHEYGRPYPGARLSLSVPRRRQRGARRLCLPLGTRAVALGLKSPAKADACIPGASVGQLTETCLGLPLHANAEAFSLGHVVFFNRASERFLAGAACDREGHALPCALALYAHQRGWMTSPRLTCPPVVA